MSFLSQVVAAGDIPTDELHVKLLVHGRSGSGKSTLGALMPKPFIILLEPNGLPSIVAANPRAKVLRVYDPEAYGFRGVGASFRLLRETLIQAAAGNLGDDVESVVLDSATEAQRLYKEQLIREMVGENGDVNDYVMTIPNWGTLTERMRRFARGFRDLPYNTLMITLSNEERDDAGKIVAVLPSFEGRKIPEEIAQFQSAVGYAYRRTVKTEGHPDQTVHEVVFQSGAGHTVKPVVPLRAIEVADPSDWIRRIKAYKPGDAPLPPITPPKAATPPAAAKAEGEKKPDVPAAKVEGDKAPEVGAKAAEKADAKPPADGGTITPTRRQRKVEADPIP